MASKINAGKYTRKDMLMVDPNEIILREELRGRHFQPSTETLIDLAVSMYENGQQQPVACRKVEDNKLLLIMGFTRTAAARLIQLGFKHPDTGADIQEPEFKLKVLLTDANEQKAFENNIIENAHRKETSPIDDAYNHHKLRDQFGYSDAEIKRLYAYKDSNKVGRLRQLLSLPNDIQEFVHNAQLSVNAAIDILSLPNEESKNAAYDKVRSDCADNGKANGSEIRANVREIILNDDNKDPSETGSDKPAADPKASKPLSMKELRTFYEGYQEHTQNEHVKEFCKSTLMFMAGKRTNKQMMNAFDKLLKAVTSQE